MPVVVMGDHDAEGTSRCVKTNRLSWFGDSTYHSPEYFVTVPGRQGSLSRCFVSYQSCGVDQPLVTQAEDNMAVPYIRFKSRSPPPHHLTPSPFPFLPLPLPAVLLHRTHTLLALRLRI